MAKKKARKKTPAQKAKAAGKAFIQTRKGRKGKLTKTGKIKGKGNARVDSGGFPNAAKGAVRKKFETDRATASAAKKKSSDKDRKGTGGSRAQARQATRAAQGAQLRQAGGPTGQGTSVARRTAKVGGGVLLGSGINAPAPANRGTVTRLKKAIAAGNLKQATKASRPRITAGGNRKANAAALAKSRPKPKGRRKKKA